MASVARRSIGRGSWWAGMCIGAALAACADPSACCDDIIRGRRAVMPLPAFCRSRFGEGSSRYPADDRRASASATCRRVGLPHISSCFISITGQLSCRLHGSSASQQRRSKH